MTEMLRFKGPQGMDRLLEIKPLEIEAMSDVRHMHAQAFARSAAFYLTEAEIVAHTEIIASPEYSDAIANAIRRETMFGGWIDGTLVGTVGIRASSRSKTKAQLDWLYVHGMFMDCGIGRRLIATVELAAIRAGFEGATVDAPPHITDFLGHLGYREMARGVETSEAGVPLSRMSKGLVHAGLSAALTRH